MKVQYMENGLVYVRVAQKRGHRCEVKSHTATKLRDALKLSLYVPCLLRDLIDF